MFISLEKKQKHLRRITFGSPQITKVFESSYYGIFFQESCISQRCVHDLEGNLKNFICIDVKNFPNL